MANDMYVPDNPDGSGDATYTIWDHDGTSHEVPYRYEHVPDGTAWEVQTVEVVARKTHLNTHRVPGSLLGSLLLDLQGQETGEPDRTIPCPRREWVISVRRCC